MKLLLVDDEEKLVEALSHLLKKNGYVVDSAFDGDTGLQMACMGIYDLIILDRILPNQDGLTLLKEFRSLGYDTPILILSAKDSPEERAEGLNAGADDYLVKPFHTVELLARLQALARRTNRLLAKNVLYVDDMVFDPTCGQVKKGDAVIQLTVKESQLFELLVRNYGRVVTKEVIVQKVWSFNTDAEFTTVNLYVHYLRKKLKIDNLVTVRGVGYCLQNNKEPVQMAN